jgi:HAD superfamily phosphoserine phosphatase-like hydrolase
MGASVDRHLEIFHAYREGRITYQASKDQLIGLWRATGRANRTTMRDIFASWPLDPASQPLVDRLRATGYRPLIITGAVDLYAQTVAARLGISDWYANTPLEFDAAGELVTYHYDLDQSGKKVRQLETFCQASGFDPTKVIAIGDGPNDLGLFEFTGHGILLETPRATAELRGGGMAHRRSVDDNYSFAQ